MSSVLKCPGCGEDLSGRQANRRSLLHPAAARIIQTFRQFFIKLGQEDKENAIFNKSGGKICRGCWSSYDRFSKLQEKIEEKLLHTLAEDKDKSKLLLRSMQILVKGKELRLVYSVHQPGQSDFVTPALLA